jgi:copper chaperone CopZ
MHPTAQRSTEIRQNLKKLYGITSRQVSVKAHTYSLGSSIRITINDPAVDIREVRNVANKHERVDYDTQTGEILCGGNRHLFIDYGDDAAEKFAISKAIHIATLMLNIDDASEEGPQVEIDGRKMQIVREARGYCLATEGVARTAWLPDRANLTPVTVARSILATREA